MSNQPVKLNVYEKARAQMLIKHPFFAAIVLSTEWVEVANDPRIPTAATDMVKVYYNPEFINDLSVDEAMFVMIHEIMHMILMHGLRRGSRKPRRWNHAGDYAINQELVDSGLTMPQMVLIDKARFSGLSAEQIYDLLEQDKKKKGKKGGKPGKPGEGGGDPGDDDDEDQGLDDLLEEATAGKSQAEVNEIKEQIKQKVAQAATMARAAGKMPANIDLLVDGVVNPPQRWDVVLREFMTRMVQSSETWNRRNRRFTAVLPSRQDVGMGELNVIGDTSGSMLQDNHFKQVATEINYCNEFVKPERTRVVWADAEACSGEQVFEPGEEVVLEPKGGGGTDMRLPLKFVEQYNPCCVILITDCYTPWPDTPTPYPLIVLSTTNAPCPPWALRLDLRNND